ncbi:hypothetical protein [Exiguobacterium sp. CinTr1]|uniref:hypothetical protein n=1 Tax=Exiguobacterium sp. CinTr1 TaxID=2995315 RepID=UPI0022E72920|nr:hypothetical protein [Exiguobacterium sp. CinTr1]
MARGRKALPPDKKAQFTRFLLTLHKEDDADIIALLDGLERSEKSAWVREAIRAKRDGGVIYEVVEKVVEVPVEVEVAKAGDELSETPVNDFDEWEF